MENKATLKVEERIKKNVKGNNYTITDYVVYHKNGFAVFSNYENAREFFNTIK